MAKRDGVFLRNNHFYISWVDSQGTRRKRKTAATNMNEARQYRAEELRKGEQAKVLGFSPPTSDSFETISKEYLSHQAMNLTADILRRETDIFRLHLNPFFSGPLADVKHGRIQKYLAARHSAKAAPATIRKELQVLKHFFRFCVLSEYLPASPAAEVKGPKEPAGRVRYLQAPELPVLLAACPEWLRPVVGFAVATGMRQGEILCLRWMDLDIGNGVAVLPKTKNGDSRAVPLGKLALMVIDSMPKGKHPPMAKVFNVGLRNRASVEFKRACRRAGIPDFRFHDLRHTYCSHAVMQGMDQHTLGKIVGHKSPRMTARYSHLSPAFLAKESSRLDGVFSLELPGNSGDATGTIKPNNGKHLETSGNMLKLPKPAKTLAQTR